MKRLNDANIIYFDPPFTILAPLKDKKARERFFKFRKDGERVRDNIVVYALPPVLPFFNRYRVINKINQRFLARFVKKRMKKHGVKDPVLWCYSPTSCDIIDKIPKKGLVYDCVDRHSAYGGMMDPKTVDRMEEDLAKNADMVFATAEGLFETLRGYNENVSLIPNGAAFEIFSKAAEKLDVPDELSGISGKIFGFVGMLQGCIDYDSIRALLEARPDYHVVFIGRALPGVDISEMEKFKNAHFLGLKPQEELPLYMSRFDVCLNVFKSGALSKDVSPLKFYEYLATGKPVVTTPEPLQVMEYRDMIYVSESPADFIDKCDAAAKEDDPELRRKRIDAGRACSWDSRIAKMREELKKRDIM